ncbi:mechanosensitive ion channel protein MscS [Ruegeria marisrubri]|uniref:Mechanosensitive ion channel protein MscS n=1 Tax=Ruegeria marisrubri TaxID=1685379 RepID=A0A0X3U1X8_9RHOB|nr:DUF3772 domain-containing protein [Ruegeria marisrubri]KUJ80896.1 mechanosensitive ion channel protein MscS [Ruegeria marisrubri]
MRGLGRYLFALVAALLLSFGSGAQAQLSEEQTEFYKEWLATAERAEEVVEADRASNAAFEALRSEIAGYRDVFNKTRTANGERIKTLESQLNALGPKPEDGAEEPEDIAALRAHLEGELDRLRVPRIISEEAYFRATGLISEIDNIIRERQAQELLQRGPSPLNPRYWPRALEDIREAGHSLANEIRANFKTAVVHEKIQNNAPAIFVLVVVGFVLIWRGKRWSERAGDYLRSLGGNGTGVWTFIVSLFRILLPWAGVLALTHAVNLTGVLGLRGTLLLQQIPLWAAAIFYFDWIGRQLYVASAMNRFQRFSTAQISEMRIHIDLLAVMLVLHGMAQQFEQIENVSDATRAVVGFPIIVATAVLLLRIRQIRGRDDLGEDQDGTSSARSAGFSQIVEIIRRGLLFLAFGAPVLAAFGFSNAAEAIIFPTVKTLALIAALIIFQGFLSSVYGWITGKGEAAQDSLFNVLVGFVLALFSIPIIAIYWGAREANLREFWSKILEGFQIGGVTISPTNFFTFVIIFLVGYGATKVFQSSLRGSLLPKTKLDPGAQNAIVAGTGYVGIFIAALIAITLAGFDLSSLAIVAGALSVGIGFGLQTIVSNFVSGIILLIERPISKGDWIDVNGMMGYVRDISVRSTRIETFDRTDVIVPNSDLISGVVTNYTRGNTVGRVIVPVGVAYGTDTRKVETILREIANAHPMVLANPAPSIVFQGFGADSLDFEIRAILRDVNWVLSVKSDMNHEINRRFAEEGIEIPFAQRDVWLRNPETLTGAMVAPETQKAPPVSEPGRASSEPAAMTEADLDADGGGDGDGR